MMKSVTKLIVVTLIVSLSVKYALPIKCYACNSSAVDNCRNGYDTSSVTRECSATVCSIVIKKNKGTETLSRDCGLDLKVLGLVDIEKDHGEASKDGVDYHWSTCATNLCNNAVTSNDDNSSNDVDSANDDYPENDDNPSDEDDLSKDPETDDDLSNDDDPEKYEDTSGDHDLSNDDDPENDDDLSNDNDPENDDYGFTLDAYVLTDDDVVEDDDLSNYDYPEIIIYNVTLDDDDLSSDNVPEDDNDQSNDDDPENDDDLSNYDVPEEYDEQLNDDDPENDQLTSNDDQMTVIRNGGVVISYSVGSSFFLLLLLSLAKYTKFCRLFG